MSKKRRTRKPTKANLNVLGQLCNLIPAFFTSKLAREFGMDKKARTFSPWSHLVSLLFAQMTHTMSLNNVCDALRSMTFANGWQHGFKRFFCLLRSCIWDGILVNSRALLCGTEDGRFCG